MGLVTCDLKRDRGSSWVQVVNSRNGCLLRSHFKFMSPRVLDKVFNYSVGQILATKDNS